MNIEDIKKEAERRFYYLDDEYTVVSYNSACSNFIQGGIFAISKLQPEIDRLEKELAQYRAAPKHWYTVDNDGTEALHLQIPIKSHVGSWWVKGDYSLILSPGTIKARTGKDLTWNDEPINC